METFWERTAATAWGLYITGLEHDAIVRAAAKAGPPGRALEVGCEGGRWSRLLADLGWSMRCTDVDAEVLEVCTRKVPEAECILVDPESEVLPAETGSTQLVLCIEVGPVSQSAYFFPEAARVLSERGIVSVVAWNRSSLRGFVAATGSRLRRKGAHAFYNESYRNFERRLERAGFEVIERTGLCWFPFRRSSDSSLVPVAAAIEARLGLRKLPRISPWVLVTAQRTPRAAISAL
jgi:SAM-dependent methyltransferase